MLNEHIKSNRFTLSYKHTILTFFDLFIGWFLQKMAEFYQIRSIWDGLFILPPKTRNIRLSIETFKLQMKKDNYLTVCGWFFQKWFHFVKNDPVEVGFSFIVLWQNEKPVFYVKCLTFPMGNSLNIQKMAFTG